MADIRLPPDASFQQCKAFIGDVSTLIASIDPCSGNDEALLVYSAVLLDVVQRVEIFYRGPAHEHLILAITQANDEVEFSLRLRALFQHHLPSQLRQGDPNVRATSKAIDDLCSTCEMLRASIDENDESETEPAPLDLSDFAAANVADPFSDMRDTQIKQKPFDTLLGKAKEQVEESLVRAYREHCEDTDEASFARWAEIATVALCHEPALWDLCIGIAFNQYVGHKPELQLTYSWAIGLYLPGFYDEYVDFQTGWETFWRPWQNLIIRNAVQRLMRLLQSAENQLQATDGGEKPVTAGVAIKDPSPQLAAVFLSIRNEREKQQARELMVRALESCDVDEESMPNTKDVIDAGNLAAQDTVVLDNFARPCFRYILQSIEDNNIVKILLKPMPDLSAQELYLLRRATSTHYPGGLGPAADETSLDENEDAPVDSEETIDQPAHIDLLRQLFSSQDTPVTYPGWVSPKVGPFDKSDPQKPYAPLLETVKATANSKMRPPAQVDFSASTVYKRSLSYMMGRVHSEMESRKPLPALDTLLSAAIQFVQNSDRDRKERDRRIQVIGTTLCDVNVRSPTAATDKQMSAAHGFSEKIFFDNWYHVRKLLQGLALVAKDAAITEAVAAAERRVVILMSLLRGASEQPLPWLLVLDWVLIRLWQKFLDFRERATGLDEGCGTGSGNKGQHAQPGPWSKKQEKMPDKQVASEAKDADTDPAKKPDKSGKGKGRSLEPDFDLEEDSDDGMTKPKKGKKPGKQPAKKKTKRKGKKGDTDPDAESSIDEPIDYDAANAVPVSAEEQWVLITNLFTELTRWAHGTAIQAVIQRYPYGKLFRRIRGASTTPSMQAETEPPSRIAEWYRQLWAVSPRCGNRDCNRLLPNPESLGSIKSIRNIFSVASKDVRVGKHSARAFISTNRTEIYPCQYAVVSSRRCNSTLVVMFSHYSLLFHGVSRGCKPSRGKRDLNILIGF